jgi:hypothetical protein
MSNDISIHQTASTPSVVTDRSRGAVTMAGESYPENPFEFFQPLIEWVGDYLDTETGPLALELELIYLNTSSIRAMMDIFDRMEEAHQAGRQVRVRWTYEPENQRVGELAEEFKEDCSFPFVIEPKK